MGDFWKQSREEQEAKNLLGMITFFHYTDKTAKGIWKLVQRLSGRSDLGGWKMLLFLACQTGSRIHTLSAQQISTTCVKLILVQMNVTTGVKSLHNKM